MWIRLLKALGASLAVLLGAACVTPSPPRWRAPSAEELGHPLSLKECLWLAEASDVRVAQWKARLQAARAELASAGEIPNPSLEIAWEDVGLRDELGNSLATKTYGVSYPLLFWWTKDREVAVAKANLRAEQASIRQDRRLLAQEIGASYFNLAAAASKVRIQEELLRNAGESLRLAEEMLRLGAASAHEAESARCEAFQAEAEFLNSQHEERVQGLSFAFALGADRPIQIRVLETDADDLSRVLDEATTGCLPQALRAKALEADPACAQAEAARQAAEAQLQLEYRRILPLSDVQGSAAKRRGFEGKSRDYLLDIPIPLFSWNRGGVKKARAELLAAQTEEENARRSAVARLSQEWEDCCFARRHYEEFAQPLVRSRAKLAGEAQQLFAMGQISYLELLQAREEWRKAESDAVDLWSEAMASAWRIFYEMEQKLS